MRNFLYDLTASQPNNDGKFHGGGQYARKVFNELLTIQQDTWQFYVLYDSTKWLDEGIIFQIETRSFKLIDIQQYELKEACKKFDIHRVYSALPFFLDGIETVPCDVIGTLHGLREFERYIDLYSIRHFFSFKNKLKQLLRLLLKKSILKRKYIHYERLLNKISIITVSRHTQNSIKNIFPFVQQNNIKLFYSPDVTDIAKENTVEENYLNHKDFFLLISGDRWIKNTLRPILALDELFSQHVSITNNVIITGVKNPQRYVKLLKNKERFIFLNYVTGEELIHLYKACFAFIYLSLNEGFGYPPLEAMRFSKPVIASPFTSIPEICEDGVIYANPYDIQEIKNRVLQLYDTDLYNIIAQKGNKRFEAVKKRQEEDLSKMLSFILD